MTKWTKERDRTQKNKGGGGLCDGGKGTWSLVGGQGRRGRTMDREKNVEVGGFFLFFFLLSFMLP